MKQKKVEKTSPPETALASKDAPVASIADLHAFSAGMIMLAEISPERMTLSQCAFFLTAAFADKAGRAVTFTDIKDALGDSINKSLHTTYKVLLTEGRNRDGKREPGLGWLSREVDPTDNRRKYLKLTQRGHRVLNELAVAIHEGA